MDGRRHQVSRATGKGKGRAELRVDQHPQNLRQRALAGSLLTVEDQHRIRPRRSQGGRQPRHHQAEIGLVEIDILAQEINRAVTGRRRQRQQSLGPAKVNARPVDDAPPVFPNRDTPAGGIAQVNEISRIGGIAVLSNADKYLGNSRAKSCRGPRACRSPGESPSATALGSIRSKSHRSASRETPPSGAQKFRADDPPEPRPKPSIGRLKQSRVRREPSQNLDRALAFAHVSAVDVDGNRRENDAHRAAGRVLKAAPHRVVDCRKKLRAYLRAGFAFPYGTAVQIIDHRLRNGDSVEARGRSFLDCRSGYDIAVRVARQTTQRRLHDGERVEVRGRSGRARGGHGICRADRRGARRRNRVFRFMRQLESLYRPAPTGRESV